MNVETKAFISNEKIIALSLVGNPANGKEFVLFKSADKLDKATYIKSIHRIIKSTDTPDWTTVYAIVEEADTPDLEGEVVTAEEVYKSCHSVDISKLLVDTEHNLEGIPAKIVENVFALNDTEINGQIIKKNTWYVAIEIYDDEIKKAINNGEITGLSRYGVGNRTEVSEMENTDMEINKKILKSISKLPVNEQNSIVGEIIKSYNTVKENRINNDIWQPVYELEEAIFDIMWDNTDADTIKTLIQESLNQFMVDVNAMTFIVKNIGDENMNEEQLNGLKDLISKSVKEAIEATKVTTPNVEPEVESKPEVNAEILKSISDMQATIDTLKAENETLKDNLDIVAKSLVNSNGIYKSLDNKKKLTPVEEAANEIFGMGAYNG